jgi:hypothetical protein
MPALTAPQRRTHRRDRTGRGDNDEQLWHDDGTVELAKLTYECDPNAAVWRVHPN